MNFNRQAGINVGTMENGNKVLLTRPGMNGIGYSESKLMAALSSGSTFTINDFAQSGRPLNIKVHELNLYASPGYAVVSVELGCTSDSQCQRDAVFACSSFCNAGTCQIESGCNCDYTCNAATEDLFTCPSDCADRQTLETTVAADNANAGNMFDIKAKNEVQVFNFEIHVQNEGRYVNAHVYTKVGGFRGYEANAAVWK